MPNIQVIGMCTDEVLITIGRVMIRLTIDEARELLAKLRKELGERG